MAGFHKEGDAATEEAVCNWNLRGISDWVLDLGDDMVVLEICVRRMALGTSLEDGSIVGI
jgi:hypothetical protein